MRRSPIPLSDASPDREYRIRRFLFGMVRDRCWSLGLREGSAVRCRARRDAGVRLELDDGRRVTLEAPYARFVELTADDGTAAAACFVDERLPRRGPGGEAGAAPPAEEGADG